MADRRRAAASSSASAKFSFAVRHGKRREAVRAVFLWKDAASNQRARFLRNGLVGRDPSRESRIRRANPMATFEIFHEPAGLWRIRRSDGLVEERFLDRKGAICFVRRHYPDDNVTIVFRGPA